MVNKLYLQEHDSCVISVYVDESEDHEMYCLKDGGVAVAARADIQRAITSLFGSQLVADGNGDIDYNIFSELTNDEDNDKLDNAKVVFENECCITYFLLLLIYTTKIVIRSTLSIIQLSSTLSRSHE